MTNQVYLATLHALSCIPLIVASLYWQRRRKTEDGAYRFLIPYLAPAGFFGVISFIVPTATMMIFHLMYSKNRSLPLNSLPFWLFLFASLLSLLPAISMVPAIGKRPRLVAGFALLSLSFSALIICLSLIQNG
jgi:hypothetical protein